MEQDLISAIKAAASPDTSVNRLLELSRQASKEVWLALLNNPNLCPIQANGGVYFFLLQSLSENIPEEVSRHPLFLLYSIIEPHRDIWVTVSNVIEKISDGELIRVLWKNYEDSLLVRSGAASNPHAPKDLLQHMACRSNEPDEYVRIRVAKNKSALEETLRILGSESTESFWEVRLAVASNTSTPEDVLRSMCNEQTESDVDVRQAAQKALLERGLT